GGAVADRGAGGRPGFAKRLRMNLWLKHLNARQAAPASGGALPTYADKDVEDFVAAAKLWDGGKPLIVERDALLADTTPDIPLTENAVVQRFNLYIAQKLGAPQAMKITQALLGDMDKQWELLDPDGS